MPTIKIVNQGTSSDAINGLRFVKLAGPALVSCWASGVTAGDTISMLFGDRSVMNLVQPNIESSADVTDVGRDQVLWAEPAPGGVDMSLPVTASTAVNFIINVDEL
jgi:hypothetical protein